VHRAGDGGAAQRRRTQRKRTAKMAQRVDTGFDAMELRTMDSVDSIDTLNPELTQRLRVRPCSLPPVAGASPVFVGAGGLLLICSDGC
jgi:hypothetical protein